MADVKIVLLGDSAVGKTALARRFVDHDFVETYKPTAAARPWKKTVDSGGKKVKLAIWDIAGHTLQLHPAFYSGAKAAMLVCDLTNKGSVDSLSQWHNALMNKVGIVPVVVAANKADLDPEFDADYVKQYGYDILKASARTGEGVEEVFGAVVDSLA